MENGRTFVEIVLYSCSQAWLCNMVHFMLQYKIRCFLMLKSLKSCKREMKSLVGSQGPVSISVCVIRCQRVMRIGQ